MQQQLPIAAQVRTADNDLEEFLLRMVQESRSERALGNTCRDSPSTLGHVTGSNWSFPPIGALFEISTYQISSEHKQHPKPMPGSKAARHAKQSLAVNAANVKVGRRCHALSRCNLLFSMTVKHAQSFCLLVSLQVVVKIRRNPFNSEFVFKALHSNFVTQQNWLYSNHAIQ